MTVAPTHAAPRVHGIPHCDTVKRARAWLAAQGVAHEFVDFKKAGVSAGQLQRWAAALGWERLLNRQGTTWRRLDPAAQQSAADAGGALALMQAQPSLVKRPVVEWPDGSVTVGFSPAEWAERAGVSAD
ncbi:Spx/MgsR family RNA polymerase-binding regulatory protein [Ideonella sp.]|uniref:Spx/MgsR family RNA polymerase-binding regulatory protein n=1 Tax=Ideonella sp. TaxID=1929293 RepID=UPI0035AFBE86